MKFQLMSSPNLSSFHCYLNSSLLVSSLIVVRFFYFRAKTNIRFHVGDVDVAAVPCGFGRAIGNKVGLHYLVCCFALYVSFTKLFAL